MDWKNLQNRAGEKLDASWHEANKGSNGLVILGHGVTGNKDRPLMVGLAEALASAGWDALRFSFAGNGASGGRFEEATISKEVNDLLAVIDAVPAGRQIIYAGHSMGGAVGALTCAREPRVRGFISLAGMLETQRFCEEEFGDEVPGEGLMWGESGCPLSQAFVDDARQIGTTGGALETLGMPVLFVHGEEDDLIPLEESQRGADFVGPTASLVSIPDADHVFSEHQTEVNDAVLQWLASHSFGP